VGSDTTHTCYTGPVAAASLRAEGEDTTDGRSPVEYPTPPLPRLTSPENDLTGILDARPGRAYPAAG
jgi:hypothetical protein